MKKISVAVGAAVLSAAMIGGLPAPAAMAATSTSSEPVYSIPGTVGEGWSPSKVTSFTAARLKMFGFDTPWVRYSWNKVEGADFYSIYQSKDGGNTWSNKYSTRMTSEAIITLADSRVLYRVVPVTKAGKELTESFAITESGSRVQETPAPAMTRQPAAWMWAGTVDFMVTESDSNTRIEVTSTAGKVEVRRCSSFGDPSTNPHCVQPLHKAEWRGAFIKVEGLAPGQTADIKFRAVDPGARPSAWSTVTVRAMPSAPRISIVNVEQTADGFTGQVRPESGTLADLAALGATLSPRFEWFGQVASASAAVKLAADGRFTVTGLQPGQETSVYVQVDRSGYVPAGAQVRSGALLVATPFELTAPVPTSDGLGFTTSVKNFAALKAEGWNFSAVCTYGDPWGGGRTVVDGCGAVDGSGVVTAAYMDSVGGNPLTWARVTVTGKRAGYVPVGVSVAGSALERFVVEFTEKENGALFESVDGGFLIDFDQRAHWRDKRFTKVVTTTAGAVTDVGGSFLVTGLAPGQEATVTLTVSGQGFMPLTTSVTGVAGL